MSDTPVNQVQENKPSDKELNFRALEAKYQRQIEQERAGRLEAEKMAQEALAKNQRSDDEDDDNEPYVDKRRLEKKLNRFGEQTRKQTQQDIQLAVKEAVSEERKNTWLKQNPDFYDVINQNAQKFYETNPELAEGIIKIPDEFERQKVAYKNIKALGIDKPTTKQPSIQEKIDANRRSPYYQPSGVGSAPYASAGDFSANGQKSAYDKMQELKNRLRI